MLATNDASGWLTEVQSLPGVRGVAFADEWMCWTVEIIGTNGGPLTPIRLTVNPTGESVARVFGTEARHTNPKVAIAAVLALGPYGRNDISARADAWLEHRGAVPVGLKWEASNVPRGYMLKVMHGEVRG